MKKRNSELIVCLGRNGTGKSTLIGKMVQSLGVRTIVVTESKLPVIWRNVPEIDPRDSEAMANFTGLRHVTFDRYGKDTFKYLYYNSHNTFILFDDCRNYITDRMDDLKYCRKLAVDFRHKMLDVAFIVHFPSDVPKKIWSYVTTFIIGATGEYVDKNRLKSEANDLIIEAQQKVNSAFKKAMAKKDGSQYGIFEIVRA